MKGKKVLVQRLFVDEQKDVNEAGINLNVSIPKMIKNATSDGLVDSLVDHLEEIKDRVTNWR